MQRLTETVKLLCVTRCWRTLMALRSSETLSQNINPGHCGLFFSLSNHLCPVCLRTLTLSWSKICIRYVVYTSKLVNSDGRVSYPMCFIFSSPKFVGLFFLLHNCSIVCYNVTMLDSCPVHDICSWRGCKPEMNMMYAGSKLALVTKVSLVLCLIYLWLPRLRYNLPVDAQIVL